MRVYFDSRGMSAYGKMLGDLNGVKVKTKAGADPCTDGTTVTIPSIVCHNREEADCAAGIMAHEIAHCRCQSPPLMAEYVKRFDRKDQELAALCYNVVLDATDEAFCGSLDLFGRMTELFYCASRRLYERGASELGKDTPDSPLVRQMLVMARWAACGIVTQRELDSFARTLDAVQNQMLYRMTDLIYWMSRHAAEAAFCYGGEISCRRLLDDGVAKTADNLFTCATIASGACPSSRVNRACQSNQNGQGEGEGQDGQSSGQSPKRGKRKRKSKLTPKPCQGDQSGQSSSGSESEQNQSQSGSGSEDQQGEQPEQGQGGGSGQQKQEQSEQEQSSSSSSPGDEQSEGQPDGQDQQGDGPTGTEQQGEDQPGAGEQPQEQPNESEPLDFADKLARDFLRELGQREAPTPDLDNRAAVPQDIREIISGGLGGSGTPQDMPTGHAPDFDPKMYNKMLKVFRLVVHEMIESARADGVQGGYTSGCKITNPVNVYTDGRALGRKEADGERAAVAIAIDVSGSMGGYELAQVSAVAAAFWDALRDGAADVGAWAFSDAVYPIPDPLFMRRLRSVAGTGTDLAINVAREWLAKQPHDRRILVVLTDGGPNSPGATVAAVKRAIHTGMEVIAFGLDGKAGRIRNTMPGASVVNVTTPESTARELLKVIRHALR